MILVSCPEWPKIFSNITQQPVLREVQLPTSFDREKKYEALVGPYSNYLLPRVRLTAIKVQNLGLISVISHSIHACHHGMTLVTF